jgi:hypothetical protein
MIGLLERRGIRVPRGLEHRHKAGIERLIAVMTSEYLDPDRIAALFTAVAAEETSVPIVRECCALPLR